MKFTKTRKELAELSNEELFALAKELGNNLKKQEYRYVSFKDGLKTFLFQINVIAINENFDPSQVTLNYNSDNKILLTWMRDLNVNNLNDRYDVEQWYHGMAEWEERDRQDFERLKKKHNW